MKTLLFLDLEFHKRTASTDFIVELLKEKYEIVKVYYSLDSKMISTGDNFDSEKIYDAIVFCQVFPYDFIVSKFKFICPIFFPMYDGCLNITNEQWRDLSDFLIISFSKTLFIKLMELNLNVRYLQFFPKPKLPDNLGDEQSIFLWQRTKDIHVNYIVNLCKDMNINSIHLHKKVDPGYYFVYPRISNKITFTYSEWFERADDMYEIIEKSALYVAPRLYEGIGMSFLNAMALGRCVIAPDFPTMNEYIEDGKTGILYDYYTLSMQGEYNIRLIQQNTIDYIQNGYEKFCKEKYLILKWIDDEDKKVKNKIYKKGLLQGVMTQYSENPQKKKMEIYYNIFNRWMTLKNKEISLSKYFSRNKIEKIAIYGYSDFAKRLLEELLVDGMIDIIYFIDKKIPITERGEVVYKSVQPVLQVDAIVVTPIFYYDEIRCELQKQTETEIVSLEKIIEFCENNYL